MGSQSTCHPTQVNTPRLNSSQTGRYLVYRPRRDGRLSWPRWLVTYRDGLPAHNRFSRYRRRKMSLWSGHLKTVKQISNRSQHILCEDNIIIYQLKRRFACYGLSATGGSLRMWKLDIEQGRLLKVAFGSFEIKCPVPVRVFWSHKRINKMGITKANAV